MEQMKQCYYLTASLLCLAIFAGCKTQDEYQKERVAYAVKHFERSQYSDIPKGKVLNLQDCLHLALMNNLDFKVYGLEEKVAKEMRTREMLGMLPELNVSNNLDHRNNTPASKSRQLKGEGPGTYSYSQSQDRFVNYLNIDLALSVLDFGLAFFNTCQSNDRLLLRKQRVRRAEQNLILETVRCYFQVAASQRAIKVTKKLLAECKDRYVLIEKMGKEGTITPFRAFDEVRRFIDMEKRLTNYIRNYENSCVELRALLGVYPNSEITVDDTLLDTIPEFSVPEVELMEQIALMRRPELFEIDMQKHINVLECRKSIVMMFPNVRMFVDFTNSTNHFLYHATWWEIGLRAAYNLLKLPQHISRFLAYSAQVDAEEARTYAQAVAVMAQVRIAHANLLSARERLDIELRVNKAYKNNLAKAIAGGKISGERSKLELAHMQLVTAETEIEKYLAVGNHYVAYYRLLNTLGIENLNTATVADLRKIIAEERTRAAEELKRARAEYEAELKKVADEKTRLAAEEARKKAEAAARAKAAEEARKKAEAEARAKAAARAKARAAAEAKAKVQVKKELDARAAAEAGKKEIAPKTIKFEKKIKTGSSDRLVDNIVK